MRVKPTYPRPALVLRCNSRFHRNPGLRAARRLLFSHGSHARVGIEARDLRTEGWCARARAASSGSVFSSRACERVERAGRLTHPKLRARRRRPTLRRRSVAWLLRGVAIVALAGGAQAAGATRGAGDGLFTLATDLGECEDSVQALRARVEQRDAAIADHDLEAARREQELAQLRAALRAAHARLEGSGSAGDRGADGLGRARDGAAPDDDDARRLQTTDDCVEGDYGATDPYGDGCSAYVGTPSWCGPAYDDDDFSADAMCCECGGGASPSPTPFNPMFEFAMIDGQGDGWCAEQRRAPLWNATPSSHPRPILTHPCFPDPPSPFPPPPARAQERRYVHHLRSRGRPDLERHARERRPRLGRAQLRRLRVLPPRAHRRRARLRGRVGAGRRRADGRRAGHVAVLRRGGRGVRRLRLGADLQPDRDAAPDAGPDRVAAADVSEGRARHDRRVRRRLVRRAPARRGRRAWRGAVLIPSPVSPAALCAGTAPSSPSPRS